VGDQKYKTQLEFAAERAGLELAISRPDPLGGGVLSYEGLFEYLRRAMGFAPKPVLSAEKEDVLLKRPPVPDYTGGVRVFTTDSSLPATIACISYVPPFPVGIPGEKKGHKIADEQADVLDEYTRRLEEHIEGVLGREGPKILAVKLGEKPGKIIYREVNCAGQPFFEVVMDCSNDAGLGLAKPVLVVPRAAEESDIVAAYFCCDIGKMYGKRSAAEEVVAGAKQVTAEHVARLRRELKNYGVLARAGEQVFSR
jgi:hypothetical protein